MGLLIDGKWEDRWYDTGKSSGKFEREDARFRNWITRDGRPGPSIIESATRTWSTTMSSGNQPKRYSLGRTSVSKPGQTARTAPDAAARWQRSRTAPSD